MFTDDDLSLLDDVDYLTWAQDMVAAGKLEWANNTVTSNETASLTIDSRADESWSFGEMTCGFLVGEGNVDLGQARERFCNWATKSVEQYLVTAAMVFKDLECQASTKCHIIVSITFAVGGYLFDYLDDREARCNAMFEDALKHCRGDVGTTALLKYNLNSTEHSAHIRIIYVSGEGTCPADNLNRKCKAVGF